MGRGLSGCLLPVLVVAGVFVALVFLGAAYVLTQVDGDRPSPAIFAAAGIGGGLLFWGLAFGLYRGFHPRRDRSLTAAVDCVYVRRGDVLRVGLAAGGGRHDVELGLVCRLAFDVTSSSRGFTSDGPSRITNRATVFEHWVPAPLAQAELTLPADAPYSHEGSAVSFAWGVHARRRGERVTSAATPIWVAP